MEENCNCPTQYKGDYYLSQKKNRGLLPRHNTFYWNSLAFFTAEDFIEIANKCKFIVIENIPYFNDENSNQQQRFITLIDILYEKKISLLISLNSSLDDIKSSKRLFETFKRTLSRLVELTNLKVV